MINPLGNSWNKSVAYLSNNDDSVYRLDIYAEDLVPLSIFCLKSLSMLHIHNTSFPNGNSYFS